MEYKSITTEEIDKVLEEYYDKIVLDRKVKLYFYSKETYELFNNALKEEAKKCLIGPENLESEDTLF
jgi:hypothetical protein